MGDYDDLTAVTAVTMTITGPAGGDLDITETVERAAETVRRFIRDDVNHKMVVTVSEHGDYEAHVTLWPKGVPDGCTCGWSKDDPSRILSQDLGCPVHGIQGPPVSGRADGVERIRAELGHHLTASTDPCQDRGVEWPCDVADALAEVASRSGE